MKSRRASEKSSVEEHCCQKCNQSFRYEGHAKRCKCEECLHCAVTGFPRHFRDLEMHTKTRHPDKYVKKIPKKADVYKKMKQQCIGGSKRMFKVYKSELFDVDYQKQREKYEGVTSKTAS